MSKPRKPFRPVTALHGEVSDDALTPHHVRNLQRGVADILDVLHNTFAPQLVDIHKDQIDIKAELARNTQAVMSAGARIQQLEQQVAALSLNVRDLAATKQSHEAQIAALNAEVTSLKAALAALQNR